jgi:hypothetical protein
MKANLMRFATPAITGLFLVSLISGMALFFHVGGGTFHAMHEWLSMVLIIPFVLHIAKNWRAFMNYFRRSIMPLTLVASTVAAVAFVVMPQSGEGGRSGPPQFAIANKMMAASPAAVAPVLGVSADELVGKLKGAGFASANADTALTDIMTSSGKSAAELYDVMLPLAR